MKVSLSLPRRIFKIQNTHTCFFRPRLLEPADLAAGLTPIDTISLVVGIMPRRRGNFCGGRLRVLKIPRMAERVMPARVIGVRILRLDASRTYRPAWAPLS